MGTIRWRAKVVDYFSSQAADYARYRPHYPAELFSYLAGLAPARDLAWDCATGNGQTALPLADHFKRVVATDVSAAQLKHARPHERVEYRVAPAEASGLPSGSVNLVTVGQALHWFDLDAFFREVRRVVTARALVAVWSYGSAVLDDPALSQRFAQFEFGRLGSYWPQRRRFVGEALGDLPFPFAELEPPPFRLEVEWTLPELVGYVRTWSATNLFIAQHGSDPTPALEGALRPGWGDPARRRIVRWPFVLRVGVV